MATHRTSVLAFLMGAIVASMIAILVSWGGDRSPSPITMVGDQELLESIQRKLVDVERSLDQVVAGSAVPNSARVELDSGSDQLVARLQALEKAIEDNGLKIAAIPRLGALEFDLRAVPPRAATIESIKSAAINASVDSEVATKDLLLRSMREILHQFGKPDTVSGGGDGHSRWEWIMDDEHVLAVSFLWGRVAGVRGHSPER